MNKKIFLIPLLLSGIVSNYAFAGKISTGNTEPAACTVGDIWIKSNGSINDRIYTCTATNTFTLNSSRPWIIQSDAPSDLSLIWFDDDQIPGYLVLKVHDGSNWVNQGTATGDNLGTATSTDIAALFSGTGECLKSDGTKGACGVTSYNDLTDKPTIPDELADLTDDSTHRIVTDTEKSTWNSKQSALVSGTNIKTINSESILGSGDIEISGSATAINDLTDVDTTGKAEGKILKFDASGNLIVGTDEIGAEGTGDITAVVAGTGLSGGAESGSATLNLADTAVTAGSYTYGNFTVDAQGRITAASSGTNPVTSESDPVFTTWDKDYTDLINKPTIPTKVSDLTNDSGFLTSEADPVFGAWNKSTGISITKSQVSDFGTYAAPLGADDNYVTDAEKTAIGTISGKANVSCFADATAFNACFPLQLGTAANNLVQLNASGQLPAVSAALLTNFPTLNQNTTGTAGGLSGTPDITVGTITAASYQTSGTASGSIELTESTANGGTYSRTLTVGDLSADATIYLESVLQTTDVDDTPVDGADTAPVSSNWAYDHAAAADPHPGYLLESALGTGVQTALGVAVGSAGAPVLYNGDGGTPSGMTLTNGIGLPASGLNLGVTTISESQSVSSSGYYLFTGDYVATLPTGASGKWFCFQQVGTSTPEISPESSGVITLDGTILTADYNIISDGTAGNSVCMTYVATYGWLTWGNNGWASE